MKRQHLMITTLAALLVGVAVIFGAAQTTVGKSWANWVITKLRGGYSIQERLAMYGPAVESRVRSDFVASGVAYPPRHLAYVAFKDSGILEVYARDSVNSPWIAIKFYPILRMSGKLGPKLREGDRQVPEGVYAVESLNPNSRFHLSIRLNYPNEFDRQMAFADGRTDLGSDIMIHGSEVSIGCLAMGDTAAEDLFVLAALAGPGNVRITIAPKNFRQSYGPPLHIPTPWAAQLYEQLKQELQQYDVERRQAIPAATLAHS